MSFPSACEGILGPLPNGELLQQLYIIGRVGDVVEVVSQTTNCAWVSPHSPPVLLKMIAVPEPGALLLIAGAALLYALKKLCPTY